MYLWRQRAQVLGRRQCELPRPLQWHILRHLLLIPEEAGLDLRPAQDRGGAGTVDQDENWQHRRGSVALLQKGILGRFEGHQKWGGASSPDQRGRRGGDSQEEVSELHSGVPLHYHHREGRQKVWH